MIFLVASIPLLAYAYRFFGVAIQISVIVGAIIVVILSSTRKIPALASVAFGFLLMYIGFDKHSFEYHLTFGIGFLQQGIPWMPLILGSSVGYSFFQLKSANFSVIRAAKPLPFLAGVKTLRNRLLPLTRGTILGFFIGLVPGLSYMLSANLAYQVDRRLPAKTEDDRVLNSVMSSDAAHCSGVMGMLLPFLVLGIPITASEAVLFNIMSVGSGSASILTELSQHAVEVILITLAVNFVSLLIALRGSKILLKLFAIPKRIFLLLLLVMCVAIIVDFNLSLAHNILAISAFAGSFVIFRISKFDPLPFIFSILIFDVMYSTCFTLYQLYF